MTSYAELAARVESVLVDVDDLAFDQLREAMADGATTRPTSDKELAKVRRSLDKALHLLRSLDDSEG